MQPEQEQIARRAVACKGWRWLAPMRVLRGSGSPYHLGHEVSNEIMGSALPDLNDPATAGILLEMLAPKLHPGDEITLFKPGIWHVRIKRTGNLFTGSLGEALAQALLALE
jgi:hypothetical protein